MDITLVPPSEVWRVWPNVFGYIQKSVNASGKRESMDVILEELLNSASTLWIALDDDLVIKSGATLKKVLYPEGVVCMRVCHIGGENGFSWFKPMYKVFNNYAKDNKCDHIEAECVPRVAKCIPRWGPLMSEYKIEELSRLYRVPVNENGV